MKKRWKRLLTLALCAGMLGLAAPATATAAENTQSLMQVSGTEGTMANVTYLDKEGKEATCASAKVVTAADTSWGDGNDSKSTDVWYVVNQNVTINGRVSVTDKIHLILMNNCTLTVNGGISVTTDMQYDNGTKKLCIYEQPQIQGASRGKLVATCATTDVTIGADTGKNGCGISISGGDIEASNTGDGAAIGSDQNNTGGVWLYGNSSLKLTSESGMVMKTGNVWPMDGTNWKVTADDKGIEIGDGYWNNILGKYCRSSKEMTFAPCTKHADDRCVYKDENTHSLYCKWCGHTEGTTAKHTEGLDGRCACGVIEASYQTLDGSSGLKWCIPIESNSSSSTKTMSGSWYVVQGNVSVWELCLSAQDTNLIIADDSSLTVRTNISKGETNQSLTIWGQSKGNGVLNAKKGSTFSNLMINSGELCVYAPTGDAITADNITLNRGKISAYSYYAKAFGIKNSICLNPASCWMVKYNAWCVWNAPAELLVFENPDIKTACTTYRSVVIEPNAEQHIWNMDASGQKHVCKYCGKEHEGVSDHKGERYIADQGAHTITRICQDSLGLRCPIILNPPAVSGGRTDIIYDGAAKEVQLTGDGVHGSTPEIAYSYKAPGENDYVPMADEEKPVNVGDYRATVSLTGTDNKKASVSIDFAIVWLPLENTVNAVLTDQNDCAYTDDYWSNKVTFTAPEGFTICDNVTGTYGESFVYETNTPAEGTVVTYYLQNDSGEVAKKSALVKIDNEAPKLTDVKQPVGTEHTLTDTSAVITFTGNDTGTYYYILKESAAKAPAAMTDFAVKKTDKGTTWTAKDGVTAGKMTADVGNKIELNELKANTKYTLYLAAADKTGNVSVVETEAAEGNSGIVSVSFTTAKTTPYIQTAPVLSGIYGDKLSAMLDRATASASVTAGKDSDVEVAGTWSMASEDSDRIPMAGTSGKYTLTFTPKDTNTYMPVTCEVTAEVAKRPITVVIEDKGRVYGEDDPVFTWSLATGEGFGNNELVGNDEEATLGITLSTTATKASGVGTYAITGVSDSANYEVTFIGNGTVAQSGILMIGKAVQAPNMPETTKTVPYTTKMVEEITLPENWQWQTTGDDQTSLLEVDEPFEAVAEYVGSDKGNYETESVTVTITRSACTHANTELRNAKKATCTQDGYSGDIYCTICDRVVESGQAIQRIGHSYDTPRYTWGTDDEGRVICTADKTCTRNGCTDAEEEHIVTETVVAMETIAKQPTCTGKGTTTYTATFAKNGFEVQTKTEDITAAGHKLVKVEAKEATTAEAGNLEYFKCDICGEYFEDGEGKAEITDKNRVVIPTKGTTPPEPTEPTEPTKPTDPTTPAENTTQTENPTRPKATGTVITETKSGATYKVTSSDLKKTEVEYKAPENEKETTVVIPDMVTIDGVEYAVTSIAKNAFKNNKKLTEVKIGKNVTSVGESAFSGCEKLSKVELDVNITKIDKNAFKNCKRLKMITIKSTKLNKKNVKKGVFKGISSKAVFKVPKSKLAAYKKLFRLKGLSKKARFKKY